MLLDCKYPPGVYCTGMKNTALQNRLRRIEGQVQKLQIQIEGEESCEVVIPQFLAVRGAVNAALKSYVDSNIQACTTADTERLQTLIKTLVKI